LESLATQARQVDREVKQLCGDETRADLAKLGSVLDTGINFERRNSTVQYTGDEEPMVERRSTRAGTDALLRRKTTGLVRRHTVADEIASFQEKIDRLASVGSSLPDNWDIGKAFRYADRYRFPDQHLKRRATMDGTDTTEASLSLEEAKRITEKLYPNYRSRKASAPQVPAVLPQVSFAASSSSHKEEEEEEKAEEKAKLDLQDLESKISKPATSEPRHTGPRERALQQAQSPKGQASNAGSNASTPSTTCSFIEMDSAAPAF
jgi:hypothetical protein